MVHEHVTLQKIPFEFQRNSIKKRDSIEQWFLTFLRTRTS